MTRPVIELDNVTCVHPGPPAVTALDSVDLVAHDRDFLAVVGPSGSGKTTLLNIAGTLARPTSGVVRLDGTDTTEMSDREVTAFRAGRIGFVFQHFHLLANLTATENVELGLLYQGAHPADRRRRALATLDAVGLRRRAGHRPSQMSGGERQRVAIARAIVAEPRLLLADEPTGNLDSATSANIIELLASLRRNRTTVILITHDAAVADEADRRIHLRDGRIVPADPSTGTVSR